MTTKYILDPSGEIIKAEIADDGNTATITTSGPSDNPDTQFFISDISTELSNQQINQDVQFDFGSGTTPFNEAKDEAITTRENSKSFGFVSTENDNILSTTKNSYKPMYHFSDTSVNGFPRIFAKEFEMLTGYAAPGLEDFADTFDAVSFVLEYFAEIIALLGTIEAITLANETLQDNTVVDTRLVEKYNLRMGDYSILEYDVFTKYIFEVLNYPKDHSNFIKRIVSFFVGFTEWMSPDGAIDVNKIIEELSNTQYNIRTKTNENYLDAFGIKNQQETLGSLANIALALAEIITTTATSTSGKKRLLLLIKKFQQEAVWKSNLFGAKNKDDEDLMFFVQMDYYYTRFAIERIHVGLKLLNRYAHEKTYLNPKHAEGPLTRVSGHRTNNKVKINNNNIDYQIEDFKKRTLKMLASSKFGYLWDPKFSDAFLDNDFITTSNKPGMTTRLRALPQLFNLGYNFSQYIKNETYIDESIFQNFYRFPNKERNERRLPKELVKKIEDYLESEYVPFYIHDVRTNEILSFHAFIESISDSFNPEYTSASGFGRIDEVKSYVKTTRNINLSFTIAATSETDHDFMWYQINKLVTLVYPQWSAGYTADSEQSDTKFTYPFTQVPTASPLVRLRLGDVLKNNYSRSSLSRIFGIVEENNLPANEPGGRDLKSAQLLPGLYRLEKDDQGIANNLLGAFGGGQDYNDDSYIKIDHPVKIGFIDKNQNVGNYGGAELVKISEGAYEGKIILADVNKVVVHPLAIERGDNNSDIVGIMKPFEGNNAQINNPITASYESGMSRGIAGFITQLDMNYGDSNWETSRIGSKAPMLVKVTLNFSPIHDIVPGIDHNGMMRAPMYNVGRVNNQFFGDSHDNFKVGDGIEKAREFYTNLKKSTEGKS